MNIESKEKSSISYNFLQSIFLLLLKICITLTSVEIASSLLRSVTSVPILTERNRREELNYASCIKA